MQELKDLIERYKSEIAAETPATAADKEAFRIKYLGTKGLVKTIMGEMKNVAAENKKEAGQLLNEFKIFTEEKFSSFSDTREDEKASASRIDLTLPGTPAPLGTRHPISIVRNRIISVFGRLGFTVAEGPEIEDDFHNFSALNLPGKSPCERHAGYFLYSSKPRLAVAHTYEQRADP